MLETFSLLNYVSICKHSYMVWTQKNCNFKFKALQPTYTPFSLLTYTSV